MNALSVFVDDVVDDEGAKARPCWGAVRELLDARLEERPLSRSALAAVNRAAAAAPAIRELVVDGDQVTVRERWHAGDCSALALAAVAVSLIDVLTGPSAERLRRCANPSCSMVFVAEDGRRKLCTQNICGNRTR